MKPPKMPLFEPQEIDFAISSHKNILESSAVLNTFRAADSLTASCGLVAR